MPTAASAGCRTAVLVLLGLLPFAGCTHVISQTTPYYEDGPYQIAGPQGDLPEGTHVWVVGREGSYSRVWTLDGVDAYVWDNAVMSVWDWDRRQATERKQAAERKQEREESAAEAETP